MKIGFDYGGCLREHKFWREICNSLYDAGHEIHIITAIGAGHKVEEEMKGLGIKYHECHKIIFSRDKSGHIPKEKVEVMKNNDIKIQFDDNKLVINEINKQDNLFGILFP